MRSKLLVSISIAAVAFDLAGLPLGGYGGLPVATMIAVALASWLVLALRSIAFTLGIVGVWVGFGVLAGSNNDFHEASAGFSIFACSLISTLSAWIRGLVEDARRNPTCAPEVELTPARAIKRPGA